MNTSRVAYEGFQVELFKHGRLAPLDYIIDMFNHVFARISTVVVPPHFSPPNPQIEC